MTVPHEYLSTSCFHGEHDYCQSPYGNNGQTGAAEIVWSKRPAQCKFCESTCRCACHREGDR